MTHVSLELKKEDNLLLMTVDGEVKGFWVHKEKDIYENADYIQWTMISMMKDPMHREGGWLWRLSNDWKVLEGLYLDDLEDEDDDEEDESEDY